MVNKRFPRPKNLEDRWLLRVEKTGHNGCWKWMGAKWARGYGKFTLPGSQRRVSAHKWGYEHYVGPVAEGLELDHLCRNHWCVNPDHLEPVPHLENVRRGVSGKVNAARQESKTHCPRGHEYTDDNTYVRIDKAGRNCKACGAENAKKYRSATNV